MFTAAARQVRFSAFHSSSSLVSPGICCGGNVIALLSSSHGRTAILVTRDHSTALWLGGLYVEDTSDVILAPTLHTDHRTGCPADCLALPASLRLSCDYSGNWMISQDS